MKLIVKIFLLILVVLPMSGQQITQWLQLGHNSYKQGDLTQALTFYNKHVEAEPKDPIGYLYRARIHTALGNESLGQLDLGIAEKLNPLSLMYMNPALRSIHYAKKSYGYDFDNLDENFVKSPTNLDTYRNILTELDIGHSQDSLIAVVLTNLNQKNIDIAESTLEQVEITDMNKSIVLDLKGKIKLKLGDYRSAEKLFLSSINHNPNFVIAYHNLSICYSLLGQPAKAMESLKQAILLKDDVSLFYFTLAKLNEKNGNKSDAIENYKIALSLDQEYKEAIVNYSQLLKSLGEYEEGLSYLSKAVEMADDDERTYFKANIQFVYGEYEESLSLYESYLLSNPNDADAMYNSGLTKILLKRSDEGCAEIDQSLQLLRNDKRQNVYNLFCDASLFSSINR